MRWQGGIWGHSRSLQTRDHALLLMKVTKERRHDGYAENGLRVRREEEQ